METEHPVASSCRGEPCTAHLPSVELFCSGLETLNLLEDATMSRVKQASKKKRVTKAAMPALGAAGLTFSLAGGASASAVPAADVQPTANLVPNQALMLGDEEIADVSLATFHLFDKENTGDVRGGVQFARGCGCGGCRGCRGCGGCRGCQIGRAHV